MNNNNYKVYAHINKKNSKIYIGITKQEVKRRWQNGILYNSITECAKHYNIDMKTMSKWMNDKSKMPQNFVDMNLKYNIA